MVHGWPHRGRFDVAGCGDTQWRAQSGLVFDCASRLFLNYRRALGLSINGFMATVIGLGGFGLGASAVVQLGVDGLVVAGAQTIFGSDLGASRKRGDLRSRPTTPGIDLTGGPDCHDFEPRSLLRFRSNLLRDFSRAGRYLGVKWSED